MIKGACRDPIHFQAPVAYTLNMRRKYATRVVYTLRVCTLYTKHFSVQSVCFLFRKNKQRIVLLNLNSPRIRDQLIWSRKS